MSINQKLDTERSFLERLTEQFAENNSTRHKSSHYNTPIALYF